MSKAKGEVFVNIIQLTKSSKRKEIKRNKPNKIYKRATDVSEIQMVTRKYYTPAL